MKAVDVFTPGKLPHVTYIDDHLIENARLLRDTLEMGAAVVSLSGPSKSGKTVFIEKNIGKDRLLQVTGAGVLSSRQLWERVFHLIGTPISAGQTETKGFQGTISSKIGADAGFLVSAKGELGGTGSWSQSSSTQEDTPVDYLQILTNELSDTDLVVFIDDFHYIPKEVQTDISNQIKEAIRNGVRFVVASVPYHSDDAIRANSDLRGRTVKIDFDYWRAQELEKIATKGFSELNVTLDGRFTQGIAREAAGSPQLMQSLCLNTCFENDTRQTESTPKYIAHSAEVLQKVCGRTAAFVDYSSVVERMKEGPKSRGQTRKTHLLTDQSSCDVYPLILRAIASDPPELTLRYQNLQRRIQQLCQTEQPSGSSVTGACSHIASIANESENRAIVEWDPENDVLDIRDPYLLFFLRWSTFG